MSQAKQTLDIQDIDQLLEQFSRDDLLSLMKQAIKMHPDVSDLIATIRPTTAEKQQVPFNEELYRLKINEVFYNTDRTTWGSEARAVGPLLRIKRVGDTYRKQKNYADAATLYEFIIRGILDNYESFNWHNDEGDLDEVVQDCVDDLGKCLLGEFHNSAVRKQIIQMLYDVYLFEVEIGIDDVPILSSKVRPILTRYTTPEERNIIAGWLRKKFRLTTNWSLNTVAKNDNDVLLLGLEADTLDDEMFLHISRASANYYYVVERLLKPGRLKDTLAEVEEVQDYEILEIADILVEYKHSDAAEHLIEEHVEKSNNTDLVQWLKTFYEAEGNIEGH